MEENYIELEKLLPDGFYYILIVYDLNTMFKESSKGFIEIVYNKI